MITARRVCFSLVGREIEGFHPRGIFLPDYGRACIEISTIEESVGCHKDFSVATAHIRKCMHHVAQCHCLPEGGFMAYTGEWCIGIYLTLALAKWTF